MTVFLIPGENQNIGTRFAVANRRTLRHATLVAVANRRTLRHDTRFVVPACLFQTGDAAVWFPFAPQRPGQVALKRFQRSGRDGGGELYIYDKSGLQRKSYSILFSSLPGGILTDLKSFLSQTVKGARHQFNWIDTAGVRRSVRFADSRLRWQRLGPDRYRVEFELEENS